MRGLCHCNGVVQLCLDGRTGYLYDPAATGLSVGPGWPCRSGIHVLAAHLCRQSNGHRRIGYPHWQADCSESEPHFIAALKRLTRLDTNTDSQSISLLDDRIYDYPMLYVVEAGFASFSQPEADTLREYLLRGGFLLVDDFHGSYQWEEFEGWMKQVFPDRPIVDIPPTHEIFNVHFAIDEFIQIPGLRALCLNPGETWELPIMKSSAVNESNASRQQPRWRGVLDDDGRVMAIINWNMDLGDAWEHADMEEYSALYTATAYRLGVNYVMYGMTH